jgi:hypothetical protein
MGNDNILDTIQVTVGDNTVATLDTIGTLANLSATMYETATICSSAPIGIQLDKGWLKNQARIFLDKRDTTKCVDSIEQLFEEFINFLEL